MIDDVSRLYIASSGGDGRGHIASILEHEIDVRAKKRTIYISFRQVPGHPIIQNISY